jgi:signal transduction histidine kinase/ligand-binding sensor domain-containing protein
MSFTSSCAWHSYFLAQKRAEMEIRVEARFLRPLCICVVALLLSWRACALSPDLRITQFYHSAWSAKEGAPTGIEALAQTRDGYLWIATSAGLFRFDGVRFERIDDIYGRRLPSSNLFTLWAPPSGGLWIGYMFGGVSFISNGRITNYGEREGLPVGTVRAFAQDKSGAIWAATTRGLRRLDGSKWVDVSTALNLPAAYVHGVTVDREGTLWIDVANSIMFMQPGQRGFAAADIHTSNSEVRFVEAPDGTLWLSDETNGLRALHVPTGPTNATKDWIRLGDLRSGPSFLSFIDREGALWMSTPNGIRRLRDAAGLLRHGLADGASADVFLLTDGLTGSTSRGLPVLEDREGNVWIGTAGGLDSFRESRLTRLDLAGNSLGFALAAGDDGAVLVGESSKNGAFKVTKGLGVESVPGPGDMRCAYRDRDGIIWLGGPEKIWRSAGQRWVAIDLPVNNLVSENRVEVQAIAKDQSGTLWVSLVRAGVFRLADSKWSRYGEPAVSLTTDNDGRVWLGYPNSQVQVVDKETVQSLSAADGLDVGTVLSIDARRRHVWVGGEHGLARFDGRRFHAVTRQGGTSLPSVSGIIESAEGDLWLNTSEGAMKVPADELRRVLNDPLYAVRYTLLDFLDGMPGTPAAVRPLPTMAEATDGRLWFASDNGVAWTDPRHVVRNALEPPVDVQSIIADGVRYEPAAGLKLPIRTRNLQISYTALSLSIPERVRFRYQLGVEQPWQDVGPRREAYFSDLAPGHYRFRVIASNNDGVWNETGAAVDFDIPPAFVQTKWFLAIWVVAGAAALWLLFILRLRQIQERMRGRLEERLSERERIARDLHDTLLQGMQGLVFKFQAAAERLPSSDSNRDRLEEALDLADEVLEDSRSKLAGLRGFSSESQELLAALTVVGQSLAADRSMKFHSESEGEPRVLHPVVREEAYRIGAEALINSFNHAKASSIELEIRYGTAALSLLVRDDGIGIEESALVETGRARHFGLVGMRERAAKISSSIEIFTRPGAGTEVRLRVPATMAYRSRTLYKSWLARIFRADPGPE